MKTESLYNLLTLVRSYEFDANLIKRVRSEVQSKISILILKPFLKSTFYFNQGGIAGGFQGYSKALYIFILR